MGSRLPPDSDFVPTVVALYLITGFLDVMRNERRDALVFERYFLGNGIPTWLLSPFNLLVDLGCHRNKGVYQLEDLPPEWRAEVETVLDVFRNRQNEIIAEIDRTFEKGRRGMFVYTWYGKENPHSIEEFKQDFRYIKTIAVSVFSQGSDLVPFRPAAPDSARPLQSATGRDR